MPPSISWLQQLDSAATPEEVVVLARDYLATLTPYEIASLPGPCKPPGRLFDVEDVTTYAFELVRHDFAGAPADLAALGHKIAHFFSSASIRLSEIQAALPENEEASRRSA